MDFFIMMLKLIFFLIFILGLIYVSLKYGGSKFSNLQSNRYIRVLERVSVSKDNSIIVTKIGEKGYVISSSNNGINILFEIDSEEMKKIESQKTIVEYKSLKDFYKSMNLKRKNKND